MAGTAHEIAVVAAIAAFGFGVDQATGSAVQFAPGAEQVSFQIVLVDAVALAFAAALVEDVLNAVEQFLFDEGFVSAGKDLGLFAFALVGDEAEVVDVFEHAVVPLVADGAFGAAAIGTGGQTEIGHGVGDAFKGVIAGGVQLPRFLDQGCAFGIEPHGVERLAVVHVSDVQVAESCLPVGAAMACLLVHFGLDIEALELVGEAVHDVDHAFHGFGIGSFAKVFFGGDQPDATFLKVHLHHGGIVLVAEST